MTNAQERRMDSWVVRLSMLKLLDCLTQAELMISSYLLHECRRQGVLAEARFA